LFHPPSLFAVLAFGHIEIAAKRIAQQDSLEEARISMWSRVRKEWTAQEEQKMPSFIKEPGEIWLDSHVNYSMLEMQGQQCTRKFTKRTGQSHLNQEYEHYWYSFTGNTLPLELDPFQNGSEDISSHGQAASY
jgi:hypothetical protein